MLAATFVVFAVTTSVSPATAQINGNQWETAVANLCHAVGWPALSVFNGSILAAGGCRDPSCLNQTSSLCNIDPTRMMPHAMDLRARINSTATRDLHVSGNTALLVTAASEVLLVRACSNLVPPYPSGPDWIPDASDIDEYRRVYSVDVATGIARERVQLRLPASRANATCVVSGRYVYVAGGVSLPTLASSTDIDVLLPLASIVRAKRYTIPTDYGTYGTTGMAGRGIAEGFVLVQPGITAVTPYTFRVTIFATQLAAYNGTLAPSPPPMVAYNGDPVISGSDDERIAVSISSHKLFVLRDPFTTIVYQDLVPKGVPSTGWNLYTATGASAVIGATPLLVQEATSSASFIAYIAGGFTAGMPVGPPQNMLQQTTLLSSDPCPNFFITPRTVHANVPFVLTMTLRARFGWRLRLSATPDCAEPISPTVDWHTNLNSVNMTAFTPSANAFVCYAGKEVTLNGVKDEAVGPFNLFDVTNELQPMVVLPEPPATTTTAAPTTTTAAPTTTTTTTTTTTMAPTSTTAVNTTAPPSTTATGTAPPATPTAPAVTTTSAAPETTTAAPDHHHHVASSGGIPMAAWAVGTVAVVALSATVVFLVIAVARPSSAPAQLLRAIVRCCPGESTQDDSIADINATQLHVLKRIGAGGWGTVYLCQRGASKGGRDDMIAVKHIPCSRNVARSLAMREIRVLQSVQGHPNVVRVFEMLVREELVTAEDKQHSKSKRGSRAAADVDDDRDDSSSGGADDGAAAVTTLHQHRGAGGGTTTYALRTKGKRGGRINADSGAKPSADDDDGDDSSVYAESYHSGDGGGAGLGGGESNEVDADSMYSAPDGTSWHNELENRSSQAASGADVAVLDGKAPPPRRRRQEGPEVHRFLCIVMRYYGRGDLRRWVGTSFGLGPGFNPLAAGFPSLRGAPAAPPQNPSQHFPTGSTMFSEYGGGAAGMSPPSHNAAQLQHQQQSPSWAVSRAAQLPDEFGVPVPETLLMSVAMQLVSTLAHLHNQGILHCDIKPENVLIADEIPKRYLQSRAERQRAKRAQRVKAGEAKPLRRNGRPVGDADDGAGSGGGGATGGGATQSGELPAGAHRFFLPIVVTDFGVAQVIRKDHRKREERRRARLQIEAANSAGTLNATSTVDGGTTAPADGGADALSTGPAGFTLPYVAPEVVASGMSGFSDKSDVWAAGVLVYGLATKQLLSGDLETSFLFERVRRCRTREGFLAAIAGDLLCVGYTPPVAEYIATMLDPDPELRPSAARCLVGLVKVGPLRYVPSTAVPRAQQQPQSPPKRSTAAQRAAGRLEASAAATGTGGDESSNPVTPGGLPHPQDLTVPLLEDV
jgi:serine/threonine protein kinase